MGIEEEAAHRFIAEESEKLAEWIWGGNYEVNWLLDCSLKGDEGLEIFKKSVAENHDIAVVMMRSALLAMMIVTRDKCAEEIAANKLR